MTRESRELLEQCTIHEQQLNSAGSNVEQLNSTILKGVYYSEQAGSVELIFMNTIQNSAWWGHLRQLTSQLCTHLVSLLLCLEVPWPRIGPPCHSPLVRGANGRPTGVEAMIIAFANAALVLSDVVALSVQIGVRCMRLPSLAPLSKCLNSLNS